MQLKVVRKEFTSRSTIGELYVDDTFECFTLEDVARPVKIPGMTAIPERTYCVIVSFSARFQRLLPELQDVPNFTGVRIHPGNTDADTEGCILVGQTKATDFIGKSRAAFDVLFPKIQAAAQTGKVFLEVTAAAVPNNETHTTTAARSVGLPREDALPARPALTARRAAAAPRLTRRARRGPHQTTTRRYGANGDA